MDASAADYPNLPVSLMRQPEQDRVLVGVDLHGEFIPFAELKLSAVDEMLASASDRQAQQVQEQAQTETQPDAAPQVQQGEPAPQVQQGEPAPQVQQGEQHGEPVQPPQQTEPQPPQQ